MCRKASPLAYNDYMRTCALSLAATKEAKTDTDLIHVLELTHEADQVFTLFNYSDNKQSHHMDDDQLQLYLNTFSSKLRDWHARAPASLRENPCKQLLPWIVEALAREIGLSGISWNSSLSLSHVRILVDSLESTRTYLDMFLEIPDSRLPSLSATQWTLLHYSFMLATTASLCIDTTEWNVQIARSIIKVENYFEIMTKRVQTVASQMASVDGLFDWFGSIIVRWEAMKARYVAAVKQSLSKSLSLSHSQALASSAQHQQTQTQTHTQTQTRSNNVSSSRSTTMALNTSSSPPDNGHCEQIVPEQQQQQQQQSWWNFGHPQTNSFMPVGGFDLLNFASGIESWMTPDSYSSSAYY
ncbi:hypothetical protein LTS17_006773 [Exophiala oligosperma]